MEQALLAQKYHPNSYRVLNTLGGYLHRVAAVSGGRKNLPALFTIDATVFSCAEKLCFKCLFI